ncbi:MAG: T9SS type A sorting domain-containing protein [Saprospiraceae bacterium]
MILNNKHPFIPRWIRGILPGLWLLAVCGLDAQIPPPTFMNCEDIEVCSYGLKDNLIHVDLQAEVTNHCISNPGLYWTTRIDLFSDGTIDQELTQADASGEYPLGIHTITFWAADGCGGLSSCQRVVTVKDCQKPTPICKAVTIELMPSSGLAEILATAMESGNSYDNQTAYNDLLFLVERVDQIAPGQNAPDADAALSVVVTCDDLPPVTMSSVVEVAVWVGDEAGNWDYCVTTITVEAWMGSCGSHWPVTTIYCSISNENLEPISLVTVNLSSNNGSQSAITSSNGSISFTPFSGELHTISLNKDINPLNGITTYDLYLMQRHLLGIYPLTSPYQLIAADINNNCEISIADILALRKMILDPVNAEFKNNTSWRFVDGGYTFPDPIHPCDFAESKKIEVLSGFGLYYANFIGIKIGDISGDHSPNQLLESENRIAREVLNFTIPDHQLEAGQVYEIPITANGFSNILGYQYTLDMDPEKVAYIDATPQWADLDRSNFGLAMTPEGKLTTSWNGSAPTTVAEGEVLYTITLQALANGLLSQALHISSSVTPAEAYDAKEELLDVQLRFDGDIANSTGLALDQNEPNPFRDQTRIGFYLPESGQVILTVQDIMGRVVYHASGDVASGFHSVALSRSDIPQSGVYYYSVQQDHGRQTRRMVVQD